MTKKMIWTIVGIAIIAVIIWGVRNNSNPVSQEDTIKIGADFALTGYGASWAENNLQGAQLAVKEINQNGGVLDKRLQLIVEDDQTDPKGAVSAATKLISIDKVQFMLAGWTDEVEAIAPIIDKNKVVTITVSAGTSDITKQSKYLFRTWPADQIAVKALVAYAKEKGLSNIGVAHSIGSWEDTLTSSFKALATGDNIQVFNPVSFQIDTQDFKTIIAKLKAERPDGMFIPITSGPFERFVNQAAQLELDIPLLYPVDVLGIGLPQKVPVQYLKNVVYTVYTDAKPSFVDAFKKEYGTLPGVSADTTYDAVYMLVNAINKAGTTDSDKVITSFAPLDGASGKIVFNQYGDRSDADVILMGFDGSTTTPKSIQ